MAKNVIFEEKGFNAIEEGVNTLANAVKVTLGARGRNVFCTDFLGQPFFTKDGVTVAEDISLPDGLQNMAVQIVKEVARKTNESAGDGTTTATVLAQDIVKRGFRSVKLGANPILLKRGIDLATIEVVEYLKGISHKVSLDGDDLSNVATISANGDRESGELIASTYKELGREGIIRVEESSSRDTHITYTGGMDFDSGYISPHFVNVKEGNLAFLHDPVVIIIEGVLKNNKDIIKFLTFVYGEDEKSFKSTDLFLVVDNMEAEALSSMIIGNAKNKLNSICIVKAPKYGVNKTNFMEDLAALTGAKVVSEERGLGLDTFDESYIGSADTITVTNSITSIISSKNDKTTQNRIAILKSQLVKCNNSEKEDLEERIAKLGGGVAKIFVGANSGAEVKEKTDRIEDAINSTRAALEEGIVEGGGVALLRARKYLRSLPVPSEDKDTVVGWNLLIESLLSPIRTIVANGNNINPEVVISRIEDTDNLGYDVREEKFVSMLDAGIIDPKKVTRCALENAASIGGMLITVGCSLVDREDKILMNKNYSTDLK